MLDSHTLFELVKSNSDIVFYQTNTNQSEFTYWKVEICKKKQKEMNIWNYDICVWHPFNFCFYICPKFLWEKIRFWSNSFYRTPLSWLYQEENLVWSDKSQDRILWYDTFEFLSKSTQYILFVINCHEKSNLIMVDKIIVGSGKVLISGSGYYSVA